MANQQQEVLLKDAKPGRQKPQSQGNRTRSTFADIWRNWWVLELISLLLGIASIVALCALLNNRDGKTAPRNNVVAGVNITLNTIVAILATIGRATLLLAVSECISQLKWTWYLNQYRRLEDLEVFDDASRGAWGGLVLLWKINIRQIASLGALLVVVGVAVDPLSQQLVHQNVRPIRGPRDSTSVLTAISWQDSSTADPTIIGQGQNSPPLPIKAAILNGLYAGNTTIDHIQPTCTGGNCNYPSYRSLAICARSADVSSHLQKISIDEYDSGVLKWYLTDSNYFIDNATNLFSLGSASKKNPSKDYDESWVALDFSESIAYKDSSAPIADVLMIYATSRDWVDNAIAASEFLLEWCVQNYTTTVINGTATTERHDAVSSFSVPDPGEVGFIPQMRDGDGQLYELAPETLPLYQSYLWYLFQGSASKGDNNQLFVSNDATHALFQPFNIFGAKVNGVDVTPNQGGGMDQLQKILDNIAVSMTNVIRTHYNETLPNTNSTDNQAIPGSTCIQETYVRVQWGWIAAPITLLAGSVLFVLAVIISSLSLGRRQTPEVWKSSTLPLLKALEVDLHQEAPSGMKSARLMEEWAKGVPVRLTKTADGGGWKLVRRLSEEKSENQDDY